MVTYIPEVPKVTFTESHGMDELMKDSEDTERSWAGIKTLPPPPGSSTVSALCMAAPFLI